MDFKTHLIEYKQVKCKVSRERFVGLKERIKNAKKNKSFIKDTYNSFKAKITF